MIKSPRIWRSGRTRCVTMEQCLPPAPLFGWKRFLPWSDQAIDSFQCQTPFSDSSGKQKPTDLEMMHSDVTQCWWNSPAPLSGNTELYLSRSVSAKQSGWLQNLWTDAGTCVHCTNTCSWHQLLWPATWHKGKHITKRHRQSSLSMEKAV